MIEVDEIRLKEMASKLPGLLREDINSFIKLITYNIGELSYYNKPILIYVDPNDFTRSIIKLPNRYKRDPFLALEKRYENAINYECLTKEFEFLQQVELLVTEHIIANKGCNSALQLEGAKHTHLSKNN